MGAATTRFGQMATATAILAVLLCLFAGCQTVLKHLSNHLTHWQMLDEHAMEDPVQAVGGSGTIFAPSHADEHWTCERLRKASPHELVAYYSPIFVQQRRKENDHHHPYPPEYDEIGEARLRREGDKFQAFVAGPPKIYAIHQTTKIGEHDHVQLTYTAWYPAHPAMKLFDVEEAKIDSCVVRVTLDSSNVPLFYETIAACGCFHKVFIEKWVEAGAAKTFGQPEKGKKFCVERTIDDDIDWEVAGILDESPDHPCRPVVFLKAGDHKVIGMGTAARLKTPGHADVRHYELTDYADLYAVPVADSKERAPFFDLGKGGKVWGAERKESRLFRWAGVDSAGQPRANDQIKLHFDQSTWGDPTVYGKYLRLAPGTL